MFGATTWPLELLQGEEQQRDPDRHQRVLRERDDDRRQRTQQRTDVRHELHQAEEQAEREGVRAPVREDPQQAEDPQRDARACSHGEAEQELSAHVAEHRVLHARREVVLRRAVPGWHDLAHEAPDLRRVDEHVDRQDDHEDHVERQLHQRAQQLARDRDDLTRAGHHLLLQRRQRALALTLDLDLDALLVQEALQVVERARRAVDEPWHVVGERGRLV
jgi:hypothetical protein